MPNEVNTVIPEEQVQYYKGEYLPKVHKIGRLGCLFMIFASYSPVFYLILVHGAALQWDVMANLCLTICSMVLSFWLTEGLMFYPTMGAAALYMGYVSGNVINMRYPVALAVQANMGGDVNTPRGQIATVIGVATSVVINILILLVLTVIGNFVLGILPQGVLNALNYCLPALFGTMLVMIVLPAGKAAIPYVVLGALVWYLFTTFLPGNAFSLISAVGISVLFGYAKFRKDAAKDEAEA